MVNGKWKIKKKARGLDGKKSNFSPFHLFTFSPKNGFTIIEVTVVFLLILGVTFLVIPRSLDNTRQAKLISKWTQTYSEIEYMFSVIKAQQDGKILLSADGVKKESVLLDIVKPYLRVTSEVKSEYKQYYMNKKLVDSNSIYGLNTHYLTSLDEILGLRWINASCEAEQICAIMSFDINGLTPPNTWGYDIFGINIFRNKIEPIGKGMSTDVLNFDCSKSGTGVYCSYYYLIGGRFD